MLLIADQDKALALAGVMGGKSSEVTMATKNILLESAVFDPVLVRRSRKSAALDSDSSYRFERGVDIFSTLEASSRAAVLIERAGVRQSRFRKKLNYPLLQRKINNPGNDQSGQGVGQKHCFS